jgi:hypothetical protein
MGIRDDDRVYGRDGEHSEWGSGSGGYEERG